METSPVVSGLLHIEIDGQPAGAAGALVDRVRIRSFHGHAGPRRPDARTGAPSRPTGSGEQRALRRRARSRARVRAHPARAARGRGRVGPRLRLRVDDGARDHGHGQEPGGVVDYRSACSRCATSGPTRTSSTSPRVRPSTRGWRSRNGFDDALLTGSEGAVSESAIANIGFFDGSGVVWPDAPLLHGITMQLLERALPELGVPSRRAPVRVRGHRVVRGRIPLERARRRRRQPVDGVSLPMPDDAHESNRRRLRVGALGSIGSREARLCCASRTA